MVCNLAKRANNQGTTKIGFFGKIAVDNSRNTKGVHTAIACGTHHPLRFGCCVRSVFTIIVIHCLASHPAARDSAIHFGMEKAFICHQRQGIDTKRFKARPSFPSNSSDVKKVASEWRNNQPRTSIRPVRQADRRTESERKIK